LTQRKYPDAPALQNLLQTILFKTCGNVSGRCVKCLAIAVCLCYFLKNFQTGVLRPANPITVKEKDMIDLMKKTLLAGIGLALKTKDEVEEFAKDVSKKLNMNEKDGQHFLKDLQKRYDEAQEKLEERVEKTVKELLKKADIVTTEELKGLKKEIRELKKAVSEIGEPPKQSS
jgi:polyhydroxyalkanoate synthesis regulator phasin